MEHQRNFKDIVVGFRSHVASVQRLMNFDRDVLEYSIGAIRDLKDKLEKNFAIENPKLTAANTLTQLETIRTNDSLRPRYETIFNQALVLLVSYFGSSVHDLFRLGVRRSLEQHSDSPLLNEHLKITFREIMDAEWQLRDVAPDRLIQMKDISFQDMQSIARAFKDNLLVTIPRTQNVDEIILAQACRHAIVHNGGQTDEKLIRQVKAANRRTLKPKILAGDSLQFTVNEVSKVAGFMEGYLDELADQLTNEFGAE